jgi:hypothetical protein
MLTKSMTDDILWWFIFYFSVFDSDRYFYYGKRCQCISGFVRARLCTALRRTKGANQCLSKQWLARVREEANAAKPNKYVLGFLVEQAVLSTIATQGSVIEAKHHLFPEIFWFGSDEQAVQSLIT